MKRAIPISLVLLGAVLLSGCLFVPAFDRVERGVNVADKIGPANSRRPLRVGTATMSQVLALLGPPQYSSDDGRRIAYSWIVINGYWVYPLCFAAEPQRGARGIQLTFDANGVLLRYDVKKYNQAASLFSSTIVDTHWLFPELHSVYIFHHSTTRPTTQGKNHE